MSKISLSPDASGTGIFTIASPNSNTNRTLTLPDDTGTIVTNSGNQAGSFTTLNTSGAVVFNDAGADVDFRVEGDTDANLLFVDASTDRVGIGTDTPTGGKLVIPQSNAVQPAIYLPTDESTIQGPNADTQIRMGGNIVVQSGNVTAIQAKNAAGYVAFGTGSTPTERMRIHASGGLSLGTTTDPGAGTIRVTGRFAAGSTGVSTPDYSFAADGSMGMYRVPGSLCFATGGTERMRIGAAGEVLIGATAMAPNSGKLKVDHDGNGQNVATYRNTGSSSPYGNVISFPNASPDNNTIYFLLCADSTANRTIIYSDGDVWTSDAGTLSSDQKLKNTITDASPKLDDVMKLRVRNFYWNEDYHPEKTDKKLIGFIAQEFEEVFPGLVTEGVIRGGQPIYEDQTVVDEEGNPVLDEEGNAKTEQVQVGETEKEYAKGIKEGKLIPILVKALQEAVERIETLEAKVAALEANNGV